MDRDVACNTGCCREQWCVELQSWQQGCNTVQFHVAPIHDVHRLAPAAAQDLSSNGTFVNGRKLKVAQDGTGRRWLAAGDRISLVMSVKPLHEQYYIYHPGEYWTWRSPQEYGSNKSIRLVERIPPCMPTLL